MFWTCGETHNRVGMGEGTDSGIMILDKRGSLPHDGGCASYCARAVLHVYSGDLGTEVPEGHEDFDLSLWVPWDVNEDGKIQSCLRESMAFPGGDGEMCLKALVGENLSGCP
jgi:hypothetical protein